MPQSPAPPSPAPRWPTPLLLFTAALTAIALLLAALSGFGSRWNWWHFSTGFQVLRWAVYFAIASCAFSALTLLVHAVYRRLSGIVLAAVLLLLSLTIVAVPLQWLSVARSVPPIHDITTDTTDPPAFEAILPLRADAPNSAAYGGEEIAEQQRAAYPDLAPYQTEKPYEEVFSAALEAARGMDWEIIASMPQRGRIEAVATTFWFGFKDDVVVRIESSNSRTRVDIRSVSRVGRSDVGTNAARIRSYLDHLKKMLA